MSKKINTSTEEIIADMIHVYEEHGELDSKLYYKHGKFSGTVVKRFGTFNELLTKANLPTNVVHNVSKENLVADVRRVYEKYNGKMTKDLYIAEGKYSRKPIDRIFGSWNKMLIELGMQVNCLINISEEDLLNDLRELNQEYGYCSAALIKQCGKYCIEVYQRRFGSINKAYVLAGLPTRESGKSVVAKTVIQTVRSILGEIPDLEVTFPWLVNDRTNRRLFLDAYFPAHNLVIEYNGLQHYQACIGWLGKQDVEVYELRKYRDQIKTKLLDEHGLRLMIIRYDDPIDRVSIIKKIATIL